MIIELGLCDNESAIFFSPDFKQQKNGFERFVSFSKGNMLFFHYHSISSAFWRVDICWEEGKKDRTSGEKFKFQIYSLAWFLLEVPKLGIPIVGSISTYINQKFFLLKPRVVLDESWYTAVVSYYTCDNYKFRDTIWGCCFLLPNFLVYYSVQWIEK